MRMSLTSFYIRKLLYKLLDICDIYGNATAGESKVRKLPTKFRNCKFELKIDNVVHDDDQISHDVGHRWDTQKISHK